MIPNRTNQINLILAVLAFVFGTGMAQAANKIVHDAEYYIIEAQNGKKWDAENRS